MKLNRAIALIALLAAFSLLPVANAAPAAPDAVTPPLIADEVSYSLGNVSSKTSVLVGGSWTCQTEPCVWYPQYAAYLKFDLSGIPYNSTISSATLTMQSTGYAGTSETLTMHLWGSDADGWVEGTTENPQIPWASKPPNDVDLASEQPGIVPSGATVVFPTSAAFADFIQAQLVKTETVTGDRIATIVIWPPAGTGTPNTRQNFASRENTTGAPAAILTLTGATPTAVVIADASAQVVSWPLYVGLGALGVMVALGIVVTRRKTA